MPSPTVGLQELTTTSQHGSCELNSGPHACKASVYQTEPFPWPPSSLSALLYGSPKMLGCGCHSSLLHSSPEASHSVTAVVTSLHLKGHISAAQAPGSLQITPQSGDEDKIAQGEGRADIYFKPISPTVEQSLKPNGRAAHICVVACQCKERSEHTRPPAWCSCW